MSLEPGDRVWIPRASPVGGREAATVLTVDVGEHGGLICGRTDNGTPFSLGDRLVEPLGYRDELYRDDGTFDPPITSWREQFAPSMSGVGVNAFD